METPGTPRAAAGFTLIELMVTILAGAILMSIAVPMFRDTMARSRLTGQANEFVGAIALARSEAIKSNQRVFFCRADSEAATACSGSSAAWGFYLVTNAAGTVIRRGEVASYGGNIAVSSTLTNDTVAFSSDGLARTNGALVAGQQITICSNNSSTDNKRQVTLGAGSRVSTDKASGAC